MVEHHLHRKIGERIFQSFGNKVLLDSACGGNHRLPLFCNKEKSRETTFCNVDLPVLKGSNVKVIVEIEESDIKPTQVCGKFLTSTLSQFYMYGLESCPFDDPITFIQILDKSKLKEGKTRKPQQFEYLEKAIQKNLPLTNDRQIAYHLFTLDPKDFEQQMKAIIEVIGKSINQ